MAEGEESNVLRIIRDLRANEENEFPIERKKFWNAIEDIQKAYHPSHMNPNSKRARLCFDSPAKRYAYLLKYAIHAAAVQFFLKLNREDVTNILRDKDTINICCLGGGPGMDVVGFAAEFCESPDLKEKNFEFIAIDNNSGWETTFNALFQVADGEEHGNLGTFLKSERISHSFIYDDLERPTEETLQAVGHADIMAVIKFVSVLPPKEDVRTLENLYSQMKQGALVVFIDNSAGGSTETAKEAAYNCEFKEIGWGTPVIKFERPDFGEEK